MNRGPPFPNLQTWSGPSALENAVPTPGFHAAPRAVRGHPPRRRRWADLADRGLGRLGDLSGRSKIGRRDAFSRTESDAGIEMASGVAGVGGRVLVGGGSGGTAGDAGYGAGCGGGAEDVLR